MTSDDLIAEARAAVERRWRRLLSSVPADVLRERDDRMRAEGWDECYSTAYDGTFVQDPNNPYRIEQNSEGSGV